jgi:hypothetical protein
MSGHVKSEYGLLIQKLIKLVDSPERVNFWTYYLKMGFVAEHASTQASKQTPSDPASEADAFVDRLLDSLEDE